MTVLYRKYRPQKITELDSEAIQEKLTTVLSAKEIPHAFLFSGPRGLGKTSSARIIAKSVNCQKNKARGEPCGECDMCVSIADGTNVDVLEIDAASNRGIDDIRDLREKIRLAPARANCKVYIIDEVHMLTTEAFNALLKTLEEPPPHTLFILCTTEPGKLPETVISRCIRFDFKKATEAEIIASLKRVAKGEKLEIEEGALSILARLGDGSFRDAHKAIEQLALTAKKITRELVEEVFSLKESFRNKDFLTHLARKDGQNTILWFNDAVGKGMDIRMFQERLLSTLREYLIKKASDVGPSFVGEEAYDLFSIEDLKKLIELISKATLELRTAAIPQLPLELVILEWCGDEEKSKIPPSSAVAEFGGAGKTRNLKPSEDEGIGKEQKVKDKEQKTGLERQKTKDERPETNEQEENNVDEPSQLTDSEAILAKWEQVLDGVRPLNHSVQALLRSCRPLGRDGKFLVIEAFYKFHKEKLEEQRSREKLEKVLQVVFGEPLLVRCVLGERERKKEANIAMVRASDHEQGQEDETIKEAEKIFGANAK